MLFNEFLPGRIRETGAIEYLFLEKLIMKMWMKGLALGGLVMFGTGACEDTGTTPDTFDEAAITAEAALVAADALFRDLSIAQDPELQSLGFMGMGSGPSLAGPQGGGPCQGTGTPGTFNCGSMIRDGFTITREVTFFDAAGTVQPNGFDPLTTNAVEMIMDASGTVDRAFWTATMNRNRTMYIQGLLSDSHVMNGTGSGTVYRSGNPQEGMELIFDMSSEATWTDVVHLQPREENPYPTSGTVQRQMLVTVTKNGEVVRSREVETLVTFNGTRYVTMAVNGETVEIDLANRGVKGRFGGGGPKG